MYLVTQSITNINIIVCSMYRFMGLFGLKGGAVLILDLARKIAILISHPFYSKVTRKPMNNLGKLIYGVVFFLFFGRFLSLNDPLNHPMNLGSRRYFLDVANNQAFIFISIKIKRITKS